MHRNGHTAHWSCVRTQLPSGQRSGALDGQTLVPAHRLGSATQVPSGHWNGQVLLPPHWAVSRTHWPVVGQASGASGGHALHWEASTWQRPLHSTERSAGQPLVRQADAALTQLPSWQRRGQAAAHSVVVAAQEPSGQRTPRGAEQVEAHWSTVATQVPLQKMGRSVGQVLQSAWLATHMPLHR